MVVLGISGRARELILWTSYIECPSKGIYDLVCANVVVDENMMSAFASDRVYIFHCMPAL